MWAAAWIVNGYNDATTAEACAMFFHCKFDAWLLLSFDQFEIDC